METRKRGFKMYLFIAGLVTGVGLMVILVVFYETDEGFCAGRVWRLIAWKSL
jgi:hypothetical protein